MMIKFIGLLRPENSQEERLMSRWRGCVIKDDEFLLWTLGTYKSEELAIRAAQTSFEQSKQCDHVFDSESLDVSEDAEHHTIEQLVSQCQKCGLMKHELL